MYVVVWVLLSMVAVPLVGFAYQWVGGRRDRRLMAAGEMVDIGGGRRLYSVEKGCGAPAVVFESGFAATSLNWMGVQDAVAEVAQTVAYDRGGLGWSAGASSARTPGKIAEELRAMLRELEVEPPYLLVGHSFGGLVMRRYALDYPEEVAGVVLVDPMRTEEWPPVNEGQRALVERSIRMIGHGVTLARVGVVRLLVKAVMGKSRSVSRTMGRVAGVRGRYLIYRVTSEVEKMPEAVRPGVAAHWSDPMFYRGMLAHLNALTASVEEMHDADPIEGVPVVVLTPGSAEALSGEALERIGTDVRQVIAEKSQHWVHLDEPELVIAAILEMRSADMRSAEMRRVDVADLDATTVA
jgi:pimeloyl-ACP methyl ester carboxylesterase